MTKKAKKTTEPTITERRAEFTERMHIMKAWNGSYHVIEIPGGDGEPIKAWPGPFCIKRAAELLLEDMAEAYVDNTLGTAFCPLAAGRDGFVADYEREAAFVEIIEKHGGVSDPRGLALLLFKKQPWCHRVGAGNQDAEIPF